MIKAAIYDAATGQILRSINASSEDILRLNISDDESYLIGDADQKTQYVRDGSLVSYPPKPGVWAQFDFAAQQWIDPRDAATVQADLIEVKAAAIARVNDWAGRQRAQHITIAPGQDMIYLAKEAEALRYLADPDPKPADYPLICAEVGITAPDAYQIAQIWAQMASIWRQVAAQIETTRLCIIAQIEAAQTETAVAAIAIPI